MKVYTFGNNKDKSIMLIPGTCCHWKENFEDVIPLLLENKYFVNIVSFTGFDESDNDTFTSMLDETKKIEEYILNNLNGKIDLVYGCSLGGSIVGLLIQRKIVHITYGILGSSDLDQNSKIIAKIKSNIAVPILYKMVSKGEYPSIFKRKMESDTTPYMKKFMSLFGSGKFPFIKEESVYNQFYTDLITPLENDISVDNTTVYAFYAKKMGKKYLARYKKHFKNLSIVEHDLRHEELLVCYPDKWVEEIVRILK